MIFGFVIMFLTLINFAYYGVFGTFWRINLGQIKSLNESMVELLLSYYGLIPFYVYLVLISLYFIFVFASRRYLRKQDRFSFFKKYYRSKVNFIGSAKGPDRLKITVLLATFVALNCFFYFSLGIYQKYSSQPEFTRSRYFSDLGVYGHFYKEVTDMLIGIGKRERIKSTLNLAQSTTFLPQAKSDLDSIKSDIESLADMSSVDSAKENYSLPALDHPHIIIYQLESVANWPLLLDPSPMPFLKKLISSNVSVDKFFGNGCITINAEFSSLCSFLPEASGPLSDLYSQNDYYCLPEYLQKNLGYQTSIHHANDSSFWNRKVLAPSFGFEDLYFMNEYNLRQNDRDVLLDVVDKIKKSDKPTFSYVIGFTTHGPHNQAFIDFNFYNNDLLITPYYDKLPDFVKTSDQDEQTLRNYLGFLRAADEGIEDLFDELQKNNLLRNTIVVIYGDHRYYNFFGSDKLQNFYYYNQIPLMIFSPNSGQVKINKIASQIDIAPTILDLLGQPKEEWPSNFIGQSIFSPTHYDYAINKCLGQAVLVNNDLIAIHDNLTEGNYAHLFINKNIEQKFPDYAKLLASIADQTDKIIKENTLVLDNPSVNHSQYSIKSIKSKSINLNQETDSDNDGLSDLRERSLFTDPNNPDTDGDGFLDGVEVIFGWDPLSSESLK